ncbi:10428_t:CDS:2, partial [Racocetra fulgida]
ERYYLCLLLTKIPGAKSFDELKTRHSKSVTDFDLPEFLPEYTSSDLPSVILEELNYNITQEDLLKANIIDSGTEPIVESNLIRLPDEIVIRSQDSEDPVSLLLNAVYPNIAENATNNIFITERAILILLNHTGNEINELTIQKFP